MEKRAQKIFVVGLCFICFFAGISVPLVLNKSDSKSEEQEKFDNIYSILTNDWYYSNKINNLDTKLIEQAIIGMTTLDKDAHTNYFDLEQAQAFSTSLQGSSVGIGVSFYVNEDKNFVVSNVYINSTADKKGLRSGDIILSFDDMVCNENDSDTIVKYIKSNESNNVKVKYIREGKEYSVNLIPGTFDSTVICNIYDDYGEIILSSFSENSGKDFAKAMARLQEAGIKKLVLDLRNNTGGYLNAALEVASTLLPENSVVFNEKDKDGNWNEQKTKDSFSQIEMDKIVVLQNGNTASASEVLIGALKDNLGDIVTCMGTKTYGKGTEQVSVPFSDGTSIKYTTNRWYTPNKKSINNKGFKPDIKVKDSSIRSVTYTKMKKKSVIKKDSVNDNAKALQIFLQYLGYDVDRTDTYFSITSSESLKQFQADNGLEASGDCDKECFNLLVKKATLKMNENSQDDVQRQQAIEEVQK